MESRGTTPSDVSSPRFRRSMLPPPRPTRSATLSEAPAVHATSSYDGDLESIASDESVTPRVATQYVGRVRQYPVCRIGSQTMPAGVIHATLLALRELHYSPIPRNTSLPWNIVDSGMLGITELHHCTFNQITCEQLEVTYPWLLEKFSTAIGSGDLTDWVSWASWVLMGQIIHNTAQSKKSQSRLLKTLGQVGNRLDELHQNESGSILHRNLLQKERRNYYEMMVLVNAGLGMLREFHQSTQYLNNNGEDALRAIAEEIDFERVMFPDQFRNEGRFWIRKRGSPMEPHEWAEVFAATCKIIVSWLEESKRVCRAEMALDHLLSVTVELPDLNASQTPMQQMLRSTQQSGLRTGTEILLATINHASRASSMAAASSRPSTLSTRSSLFGDDRSNDFSDSESMSGSKTPTQASYLQYLHGAAITSSLGAQWDASFGESTPKPVPQHPALTNSLPSNPPPPLSAFSQSVWSHANNGTTFRQLVKDLPSDSNVSSRSYESASTPTPVPPNLQSKLRKSHEAHAARLKNFKRKRKTFATARALPPPNLTRSQSHGMLPPAIGKKQGKPYPWQVDAQERAKQAERSNSESEGYLQARLEEEMQDPSQEEVPEYDSSGREISEEL